jgi:DNA-binding phage protein
LRELDRGPSRERVCALNEERLFRSPVPAYAGISRESLYRALSPKGNPTLKTLVAVLKTVGMRLSIEPEHSAAA